MTSLDLPYELYEFGIRNEFCRFFFDPLLDNWSAISTGTCSKVLFRLSYMPEAEQTAYPQALEVLRTHKAQSNTTLIGHGTSPSVVDDHFLNAALKNPHLHDLALADMVISVENLKTLHSLSSLERLSLQDVQVRAPVPLQPAPLKFEWPLNRSLLSFSFSGIEHSIVMSVLAQLADLPNVEHYCVQIQNEQQALAMEKVLKASSAPFIEFWETSFTSKIVNPILHGLDQSPVSTLFILFDDSCHLDDPTVAISKTPSDETTNSWQNHFFEELTNNLRILYVGIEGDSVSELQGWFDYREQNLSLVLYRQEIRPSVWPHVLEHVLKPQYGSDFVFFLLRKWPLLVPSSRKRVRAQLSNY